MINVLLLDVFVLAITMMLLSMLPVCVPLLKVAVTTPDLFGIIGALGKSVTVQPQVVC